MKKLTALIFALMLLFMSWGTAEEAEKMFIKSDIWSDGLYRQMEYYVYTPEEITPQTPLVVFLHGGGEVGSGALSSVLPQAMLDGTLENVPAVVLIPQMPSGIFSWLRADDALEKITADLIEQYGLDAKHLALCGFSMGGIGSMDIADAHPGKYQRVLVAAGRVNTQVRIQNFTDTRVRFYVGSHDHDIKSDTVYQFEKNSKWAGGNVTITLVDGDHMGTQRLVFTDPAILEWLFEFSEDEIQKPEEEEAPEGEQDGETDGQS